MAAPLAAGHGPGAFVAVALFDVLPDLSGWLHIGVLAARRGAGRLSLLAWYGFRRPTGADAKRRLERESGLDHRPLTAIEDNSRSAAAIPTPRPYGAPIGSASALR